MSSAAPAGFELCPPGSFSLCADPQYQAEAARELQAVSEQVRAGTRRYSALGLILTGSFARGEATLLVDPEVGVRWLSDIECLVVFPADRQKAPIAEVDRLLRGIESERNLQASNAGSGIKLELRSIQAPRLARLRPAISAASCSSMASCYGANPRRCRCRAGIWLEVRFPRRMAFAS